MEFRIGINLGDVMVEGAQIYGDGVNIAARLESLSEPGGICIAGAVYEQVKNKLALRYEDLGEQRVKNIAEPVRVWRVVIEPEVGVSAGEAGVPRAKVQGPKSKGESRKNRGVGTAHRSWTALVAVGLLIVGNRGPSVSFLSGNPHSALPNPQSGRGFGLALARQTLHRRAAVCQYE